MPIAKIVEALKMPNDQDVREYHITVMFSLDDGTEVSRHKFIFPPSATLIDVRDSVVAYGQALQGMVISGLIGQSMTL